MSFEYHLEPWSVAEENCNTKGSDRGHKDIDIFPWRVLEHAKSAASSCEQVTPLHDNQGKEIYTLCLTDEIICRRRVRTIS